MEQDKNNRRPLLTLSTTGDILAARVNPLNGKLLINVFPSSHVPTPVTADENAKYDPNNYRAQMSLTEDGFRANWRVNPDTGYLLIKLI